VAFNLRERTRKGLLGLLCAVVLGPVGCEETGEELGSDDFRKLEKEARCEYFARCGIAPDYDSCIAAESQDAGYIQAVGSVPFGRVEYDPIAADEYLQTLRDLSCDGTQAVQDELTSKIRDVFKGNVPLGEPCWADEECEGADSVCDDLACQGSGQLCCFGTCTAFRTLQVGDACPLNSDATNFSGCSNDAYCAPPEDDGSGMPPMMGTCTPRSDNGMMCSSLNGCQDGQRCNVGDSNLCYVLAGNGAMCNPTLSNGSCIRIDQVCDPGSSTCVSAPGPGAPCVNGRCQLYAVCQEDTCVARPREFEACDGSVPCLGDLNCQDGVCQRSRVALVCVAGEAPPADTDGG
jgi:hypothetical protein